MKSLRIPTIARLRTRTIVVLALLASACATQIAQRTADHLPQTPSGFPAAFYERVEARGGKVLHVIPAESLVAIRVHKAGALARFGHDHIVAAHNVEGLVAPDDDRADLYVPLDKLAVDEPALLAEEGFDIQPSADAIEGTRTNMLDKVLETARYPFALIRISTKGGERTALKVTITLHGTTRTFDIPADIRTGADEVVVRGRMSIHQSDFGMRPFSVMGGALSVGDKVDMDFRIVANRKAASPLLKNGQ